MASFICPECKKNVLSTSIPDNYRGTLQCTGCANVSRVVLKNGFAVDVRPRIFDLDIPDGLPTDLEKNIIRSDSMFRSWVKRWSSCIMRFVC